MWLRSFAIALGLTIVMLLGVGGVAHADDSVDAIASQLETSSVYVSDDVVGASGIRTHLQSIVGKDGDIILVVMPESETDDPDAIARNIVEATGGYKVIGLAVGSRFVGYVPNDPTVAADMMRRAEAVSTSTAETLTTYTQSMRKYLSSHPLPKPPPPPAPPEPPGPPFNWAKLWWIVGGSVGAVLVIAIVWRLIWAKNKRAELSRGLMDRLRRDTGENFDS